MSDKYDFEFENYLEYNELSPSGLVWKPRGLYDFRSPAEYARFLKYYSGKQAGCIIRRKDGYESWQVKLLGKKYTVSKIIYILFNGPIPAEIQIDHEDGYSLNNKITNLRQATPSQNQYNSKTPKNNTSGYKGVTLENGRWRARIGNVSLGYYNTKEEASKIHNSALIESHGEFARIN